MGHFFFMRHRLGVKIHLVPTGIPCAYDVSLQIVANVYRLVGGCFRFCQGKLKNLLVWFQCARPFTGDYLLEIRTKTGGFELGVLHLLESIGDQVQDILGLQLI